MLDQVALLRELDFERVAGTEGEVRAREVLGRVLAGLGVPWRLETFRLRTSRTGRGRLAAGGLEFAVQPFGLCGDRHLSGPLHFVENLDALHYGPGRCDGGIVVYFDSTLPVRDVKRQNRLLALVRVGNPDHPATSYNLPQTEFAGVTPVPMVSISYEDAVRLRPLSGLDATLHVEQEVFEADAANIVVPIAGREPDRSLTWAVAHYDCPAGTHGAGDNAAGTVNLMRVVERFALEPPKRDLCCVFCTGEELGLLGSRAYVREHLEEVRERGRLVVNLDLSGEPIGRNWLMVTGTPELKGWAGAVTREDGYLFEEKLDIYSSDNMPFVYEEVPAVSVARLGGRTVGRAHTAWDRAENVAAEGLEQTSGAALSILTRVLGAKIYPVRREIDPSLREKVEKYQYQSTKEKPSLTWRAAWEK